MAEIVLALGSNLGDRQGHLREAAELLEEAGLAVIRRSSVWETEPVPADQPEPVSVPEPPPFPPGAQHAYIDLARVAGESIDGQAANLRVQTLSEQKLQVLEGRNVELQASQTKLQQNANVMSEEAQLQLRREIDRLSIEVQRMTQDAETEIADLQQRESDGQKPSREGVKKAVGKISKLLPLTLRAAPNRPAKIPAILRGPLEGARIDALTMLLHGSKG